MDIVLNTNFNNPNLPIVPVPGFYDDFTSGGGGYETLGVTHDNKPWDYMGGLGWFQRADGTATGAGLLDGVNRSSLAVVNGVHSDGTLVAKIALESTSDLRYGIALRVTDSRNYLHVSQSSNAAWLRIYKVVDNQSTVVAQVSDQTLATGDILQARFSGPQINVLLNNTLVLSGLSDHNMNATHHGFFNWSTGEYIANPRWDWIRFE